MQLAWSTTTTRPAKCIAIGALLAGAMYGVTAAQTSQTLPVPLNEIMPRMPPVPSPVTPAQPAEPCRFPATVIPLGDTNPATRAEQTPDGIALYGGEGHADETAESPACPIQPN